MSQEEIQERNKQIALMLGLKLPLSIQEYSASICFFNGNYHSDWNWLMEALKYITKLGWNWQLIDFNGTVDEPNCFQCEIFNLLQEKRNKIFYCSDDPINAVFIAVSDFAKLYNEKKL